MYRLLIVDDEPGIVDGLYQVFKQDESFELDVVKAYSGMEALDYLRTMRIDVLLSDIRMPGLSGLNLLDEVVCNWPGCRVILLTGYSEFDYVYTAIQNPGVKYILKTEGDEVVIDAVKDSINQIAQEIEQKDIIDRTKKQVEDALPILQKDFFMDILQGEAISPELRHNRFKELRIGLDASLPVVIVAGKINKLSDCENISGSTEMLFSINNIFHKKLNPATLNISSFFMVCDKARMLWVLQPCSNKNSSDASSDRQAASIPAFVKGILESTQNAVKIILKASVSFAVSDKLIRWEEISRKFEYLNFALNNSFLNEHEMLISGTTQFDNSNNRISYNAVFDHVRFSKNINERLILLRQCMDSGDVDYFNESFDQLLKDMKIIMQDNFMLAMELYYSAYLMFLSYLNEINAQGMHLTEIDMHGFFKIRNHGLEQKMSRLREVGRCISMYNRISKEKESNGVVECINRYINENLDKDLSLARLADIVYFNPSYLSRYYKQMTGKNLTEYLNEVRLNKAKVLLADKRIRVNDIAWKLGFNSPSYFTAFFKKLANITPQEYRDTL